MKTADQLYIQCKLAVSDLSDFKDREFFNFVLKKYQENEEPKQTYVQFLELLEIKKEYAKTICVR